MATTNAGAKAGALAVDGCEHTADGGMNVFLALEKESREKAEERVAPTVERDPSCLGAGKTALGRILRSPRLDQPTTHRLQEGATASPT